MANQDFFTVHYLHGGRWIFGGQEDTESEAKEVGRDLWRSGVAGVRITATRHEVILEEIRK